jgi:uncharacterized OB-fold protein
MPPERKISQPPVNPENAPYFEAAARGKLMLKYCEACKAFHFYPRTLCPFCFSDRTQWREATGRGTVYSYSVMRRGGPAPYAIAYVKLEEGVTVLTNLVDCDLEAIRIGVAVHTVFKAAEGGFSIPMFTPTGR